MKKTNRKRTGQRRLARPRCSAQFSDIGEMILLECAIEHNVQEMRTVLDRMNHCKNHLREIRTRLDGNPTPDK